MGFPTKIRGVADFYYPAFGEGAGSTMREEMREEQEREGPFPTISQPRQQGQEHGEVSTLIRVPWRRARRVFGSCLAGEAEIGPSCSEVHKAAVPTIISRFRRQTPPVEAREINVRQSSIDLLQLEVDGRESEWVSACTRSSPLVC